MRQISIAIPTWNRYEMTVNSFKNVLDDERIGEVVIVDDASTDDSYDKLKWHFRDNGKVKIFRNDTNKDCYFNKHEAVKKSTLDWVILFDSDNTLDKDYIDTLYGFAWWDRFTIYQPVWAKPHFNFTQWSGLTITKNNVAQYANTHLSTAMNAMNFFINRAQYLRVWDGSVNAGTSDSLYFSFCWLKAGGKIFITPDLTYDHFISDKNDGHYQTHSSKYVKFHENLMNQIRQLK